MGGVQIIKYFTGKLSQNVLIFLRRAKTCLDCARRLPSSPPVGLGAEFNRNQIASDLIANSPLSTTACWEYT